MLIIRRILSFMFIAFMLYTNTTLLAVNDIPEHLENMPTVQYMLQNANMGTTFYIAIPQNDIKGGAQEEILAIFVCSYTDTKVKLRYPKNNIEKLRDVKAFKPTVLSSENNDATFVWEVTESEVIGAEAIILTSDDPVAVYVLSSKNASSDGYLAIPTAAWGKKYVHSAYYDHRETIPTSIRRGAGFIVVAAHDGTGVSIKLNGAGAEVGETVGNKKIGETISITLKSGQTYMVRGNGNNIDFDLTGTIIESTKPVGVISFHQRTMVPNKCPNGRDHLNEMLLPVESWGTDYVSLEYNRNGQGDLIRVVAYEDGTVISADQYDPGSGNAIADGHIETFLNKGKFWEYLQATCGTNNRQNGVRGVTVWKSNKPIQIMQLAYSYPWDRDVDWDPLMINVQPVKQYQRNALLMPATAGGFFNNELTFFAECDPLDLQRTILNTLELNGEKVSKTYPQFMYHNITGTNLVWGRIKLSQEVHALTSNTKLSGYITGFSGYNSYGWPAMFGTNKIDELDTLPPVLSKSALGCGNYKVTATEQRNSYGGTNPQKDQGLRNINIIKEASYNYNFSLSNADKYFPELFVSQQDINISIIDVKSDAKAYFLAGDRAGNFVIDSVEYIAPKLQMSSENLDFEFQRMYKKHYKALNLKNAGTIPIVINAIKLNKAIRYKIDNNDEIIFPLSIMPDETASIRISFEPVNDVLELDSLIINTECINYSLAIKGTGKYPKINTDNWDAGTLEVGKKVCLEDKNDRGLRISNGGNDTLTITGVNEPDFPFTLSEAESPSFPIVVPPNEIIYFKSICFEPTDSGSYETQLVFICDDEFGNNVATLKGSAFRKVNVNESLSRELFNIQPNPTENKEIGINFNLVNDALVTIELFDITGRLIEEIYNSFNHSGNHYVTHTLGIIPTGAYYIKFKANKNIMIKKLIVN